AISDIGAFESPTAFVVNTDTDEADVNTTDGVCDTDLAALGLQCTLRAAIQQANASTGSNMISFNIPGDGVHTISPTSALPPINASVTIDGYTQPGSVPNSNGPGLGDNSVHLIELRGDKVGGPNAPIGLRLAGGSSVLRGLVVWDFSQDQIFIHSSNNVI